MEWKEYNNDTASMDEYIEIYTLDIVHKYSKIEGVLYI